MARGGTGIKAGLAFFENKEQTPRPVQRRAKDLRGSSLLDQPASISVPNFPSVPSLPLPRVPVTVLR